MNQEFPVVAEMNVVIASHEDELAEIVTKLQQKLGIGTAGAITKRMVAIALAQQALALLQRAAVSVEYFQDYVAPSSEEPPPQADDSGRLGERGRMAAEIAANMAEKIGVDATAIPLFLVEGVMLTVVSDMLNQVKKMLAQADAAESMAG